MGTTAKTPRTNAAKPDGCIPFDMDQKAIGTGPLQRPGTAVNQRLFDYYLSVWEGGPPTRSALNPLKIGADMGHMYVVEIDRAQPDSPDGHFYHFYGEALFNFFGYDVNGKTAQAIACPERRTAAMAANTMIINVNQPILATGRMRGLKFDLYRAEAILLPLVSPNPETFSFFGAFVFTRIEG